MTQQTRTLKKFHASGYKDIKERLVTSETDTMIFIGHDQHLKKDIRVKKYGKEEGWFNTWEEAHAFLTQKVEKEVAHAELALRMWRQTQVELATLKPE